MHSFGTLTSRMLVASARLLMTGPSTKVGQMVTSSKPAFLLAAHASFSAATYIMQCSQSHQKFLIALGVPEAVVIIHS